MLFPLTRRIHLHVLLQRWHLGNNLLVFRDQIVQVRVSFGEFHLVHTVWTIPSRIKYKLLDCFWFNWKWNWGFTYQCTSGGKPFFWTWQWIVLDLNRKSKTAWIEIPYKFIKRSCKTSFTTIDRQDFLPRIIQSLKWKRFLKFNSKTQDWNKVKTT